MWPAWRARPTITPAQAAASSQASWWLSSVMPKCSARVGRRWLATSSLVARAWASVQANSIWGTSTSEARQASRSADASNWALCATSGRSPTNSAIFGMQSHTSGASATSCSVMPWMATLPSSNCDSDAGGLHSQDARSTSSPSTIFTRPIWQIEPQRRFAVSTSKPTKEKPGMPAPPATVPVAGAWPCLASSRSLQSSVGPSSSPGANQTAKASPPVSMSTRERVHASPLTEVAPAMSAMATSRELPLPCSDAASGVGVRVSASLVTVNVAPCAVIISGWPPNFLRLRVVGCGAAPRWNAGPRSQPRRAGPAPRSRALRAVRWCPRQPPTRRRTRRPAP